MKKEIFIKRVFVALLMLATTIGMTSCLEGSDPEPLYPEGSEKAVGYYKGTTVVHLFDRDTVLYDSQALVSSQLGVLMPLNAILNDVLPEPLTAELYKQIGVQAYYSEFTAVEKDDKVIISPTTNAMDWNIVNNGKPYKLHMAISAGDNNEYDLLSGVLHLTLKFAGVTIDDKPIEESFHIQGYKPIVIEFTGTKYTGTGDATASSKSL